MNSVQTYGMTNYQTNFKSGSKGIYYLMRKYGITEIEARQMLKEKQLQNLLGVTKKEAQYLTRDLGEKTKLDVMTTMEMLQLLKTSQGIKAKLRSNAAKIEAGVNAGTIDSNAEARKTLDLLSA